MARTSGLLQALADGSKQLVRVTFPLGALPGAVPKTLNASRLGVGAGAKRWKLSPIWAAPADATVPGRSFFSVLRAGELGEGERIIAWAPIGVPQPGVLIPADAAVISDGKYWCYIEAKPGTFVRTEIDAATTVRKRLCRDPGCQGGRQSRHARRGTAARAGIEFRRGRGLARTPTRSLSEYSILMRAIVSLCVRHFGAVTALSLFALILGCWGAMHAPLDVFPEFVPSQVDIQTEAPGFAPQQVEELVTKQVENAVNGAPGLATLRSESIPGLSVVTITFTDGIDVHIARQGISERLSELGSSLPAGCGDAQTFAAGLEHHGPAENRTAVRASRCLCAARHGGLDHQATLAGGTRRGARHRLRRRSAPNSDSARHGQARQFRHHVGAGGGCRARRAADTRRGLHRLARPARAHPNAHPAARHRRD